MATEQMKQSMSEAEKVLYKAYNRYQVMFERGDGVRLYDTDGTEYLDFFAGIAVNALGYHYPGYDEALKAQIDKFQHISNYFYNPPALSAGEKLLKASQMDKVFFTMSVTGKEAYRAPFEPLIPGIRFATFNDLDSVKAQITDKTCGIIVEPIQGEGGIYPATDEFLKGLRKLADEHDFILIFDEIQCGMGRSGKYFAWQYSGVKPDVLTVAKALGNGVPIGAFLTSGKGNTTLKPGDHGTTYGGNPFVCAAADAVLTIMEKDDILKNVNETGAYLKEKLEGLKAKHPHIVDIRGKGMMYGVEFDISVNPIINRALLDEHIVLINAGTNILRIIPALIVTKEVVDEAIEKIDRAITAEEQANA